jgi:hypothetical protein
MATIIVPKTPAKAYDPNRRPSDLIRRQIQHLEWALLPAAQRDPRTLRAGTVTTEAQAAEYIALLTARVHDAYGERQAAPPDAGPLKRVTLPPVPTTPRRPRTAAGKPARKPTSKPARKATSKAARKVAGKSPATSGRKAESSRGRR